MNKKTNHTVHEPLFHLVKRSDLKSQYAWLIRGGMFIASLLLCFIVTFMITKRPLGKIVPDFFKAIFGTERNIWNVLREAAVLLLLALAVTPSFKMKFWNIGGEGQALMGALGASVIIQQFSSQWPIAATIIVSLVLAILFSVIWAVIPAIFKAIWNTNETLLTLMMNYIATCLTAYFIKSVASSGTGTLTFSEGVVQPLGSATAGQFILTIVIAIVLTVIMALYLKHSKQGYEINVVGESINTARYIGINVKKVIIRTLVISGVIGGIVGFTLVSVINHSLGDATVGGRGFTAVLVSWLGHFNPAAMSLTALLVSFIKKGATQLSDISRLGASFPSVLTGIFFFFIIASEFFINYQIKFKAKTVATNAAPVAQEEAKEEVVEEATAKEEE